MTKLAKIASIVAFVMAGLAVIGGLTATIIVVPLALIPLAAGICILRRRVWGAFGFAFYLVAQLLLVPFVLYRAGEGAPPAGTFAEIGILVILIPIFFFAGRSLKSSGAAQGRAWPWIMVSVLTTLPILFVQAFVIPNGSMEDTLLVGDRIFVQRFPKPRVERGDVIVFAYPVDHQQTFIKRAIGLPGDHIRITDKVVYRNGVALNEPYAIHKAPYPDSYRDNFPSEPNFSILPAGADMLKNNVTNGEVVVPGDKYFVLGDNRDNSLDSRYWGLVGSGDVLGKPILIYDSEETITDSVPVGKSISPSRRWSRFFKAL
jgi:signal peptidase I